MLDIWLYSLGSVLIVSLISFIGIFTLGIKVDRLRLVLIYLIAFSAGALFGDAFFHLLPEISEEGLALRSSVLVLAGILIFFSIEKFIHWQHCHLPLTKTHIHPFAYINLVGDGLHNLLDGVIIGAAYLISLPAGLATSLAVIFHEIPQEIGDFGVLLHGGFSKGKAIMVNFLSALTAFAGAIIALLLAQSVENIQIYLVPIAIGGFLYIAGSDLIPELHKDAGAKRSLIQLIAFVIGIAIMGALLLLE